RQAQPGSDSFANNFINFLRFYYLRKLSNNSRFEMNINSNYENTHGILNNTLDELESSDFSQIHHGNAVYPKFNGDFNLFYRNITYIVGGDFSNENYTFSSISNSLSSATNDIRYVGSGYGFLTIPIMEKLNLKLGIRGAGFMDNFSNTKNNSDTVSVSEEDMTYHLTTATSTYIRRAENYRFPKIDEEINYTATGQQVLNPLKTQTGVSYETGVKYVSSRTLLNLTLYQLTLNNEIEYIPTVQSSSLYNTQNLPQTVRHGIIGGVDLILTKKVTLSTQFTYTNPKIVNSGDDIPSVPELTARLGIAYHFNDNWSTHLEALYTGSSYAAGDISNISAKQPGYSIINLNIQWQIKKLILSAKINNLFNKKYNAYALFNPTTGASYYPASGINMYLTANYLVN
ncbi:MAG: TonB-dependent receptor domain-containing protein, partial [Gammaproteobacteria bacterium]